MPRTPDLARKINERMARDHLSFRGLAVALGLPVSAAATLNRIVRGESASADARLEVARALGLVRPPRKLIRRTMSPAEAHAWDALPRAERLRRLQG